MVNGTAHKATINRSWRLFSIFCSKWHSRRDWDHWEEKLENKDYREYVAHYDLQDYYDIIRYDRHTHRAVFLVKKDDKLVDAVGRALYKNKKPKWYRYGNSGYPFIHGNSDTAIIVEDVVSALTLSKFCTGIALLGTNLLQSHIDVLKKYKRVGIALDKDASKKAVQLVDDLALNMNAKFLLLEEDIKEMLDEDIKKLVDKVNKKAWGWMNDTYWNPIYLLKSRTLQQSS